MRKRLFASSLLILSIITIFSNSLLAVEIKIDSSIKNSNEIVNFYKKVDEFLSKTPFPDSAIKLKVADVNIKKDSQDRSVLYATLNIEFNDQYFLMFQQLFDDYRKAIEIEASNRTCSAFILGKRYTIPCKIGLEVTKKLYESAKKKKINLSTNGLNIEEENLWYDYALRQEKNLDPFPVFVEYRLKSEEGIVLQKGLIENTLFGVIKRPRYEDIGNILPLPYGINLWYSTHKIYALNEFNSDVKAGNINTIIKCEPLVLTIKPEDIKDIEFVIVNTEKWENDKRQKEEEEAQEAKIKAEEEARRNSPEYKRSAIAEELCQQYESLSQTKQAIKRQNEVDLTTGTTNLYETRQLGAAKMYIEKEIESLKKEYKKLGGGDFSRKKQCE